MAAPFSRRMNRFTARLLLGVLLFVQMLMAAHACTPEERSASFGSVTQVASGHCHEQEVPPATAPEQCLFHCSLSDQSRDTPQVDVPALPALPALIVPLAADATDKHLLAPRPDDVSGGDPPIPILFQVFRS
jgi:hypothetical protein